MKPSRSSAIAVLLVAASACAAVDSVKSLVKLSAAIHKEFGAPNAIDLGTKGQLTVTFTAIDAASLPPDERELFARHVAEFVVTHYPQVDSVISVAVGFKPKPGSAGMAGSSTIAPYTWTVVELRAAIDSASGHADSAKTP